MSRLEWTPAPGGYTARVLAPRMLHAGARSYWIAIYPDGVWSGVTEWDNADAAPSLEAAKARCERMDLDATTQGVDTVYRSPGGGDYCCQPGWYQHVADLVESERERLRQEVRREELGWR